MSRARPRAEDSTKARALPYNVADDSTTAAPAAVRGALRTRGKKRKEDVAIIARHRDPRLFPGDPSRGIPLALWTCLGRQPDRRRPQAPWRIPERINTSKERGHAQIHRARRIRDPGARSRSRRADVRKIP